MAVLRILILLGAVHGVFLGIAVFAKRRKSRSNFFLALWIFALVYLLLDTYLYLAGIIASHICFFLSIEFDLFLLGPFSYFYVKSLTDINFKFRRVHFVQLVPAVLSLLSFLVYLLTNSALFVHYYNYAFTSFLWATIYMVVCITVLFKKRYGFYNWMITRERKIWIFSIIILSIVSWVTSLLLIIFAFSPGNLIGFKDLMHTVIAMNIAFEIYLLGYFSLSHPVIFVDEIDYDKKYPVKQILTDEDTSQEYERLKSVMEQQKAYMDTELTLDDLSILTRIIPPPRLSQIIRKHEKQNFNEFLNSYRLHEVKNLLSDPENKHKSILELAFTAGFNSKATFNRVFKEVTGMIPKDYRRQGS
ncbi:MAG: AraC family transcriptional regulator [Spirochaetales bacterium]|nr:AraC family transcriptional regulator [Spirochaetales bacterium]